jgi:O-glycosyl hydrolase
MSESVYHKDNFGIDTFTGPASEGTDRGRIQLTVNPDYVQLTRAQANAAIEYLTAFARCGYKHSPSKLTCTRPRKHTGLHSGSRTD